MAASGCACAGRQVQALPGIFVGVEGLAIIIGSFLLQSFHTDNVAINSEIHKKTFNRP